MYILTIKVSILIPVKNGFEFTQACLKSLFLNLPDSWGTGKEFEVIVFDDGSQDATANLLREYSSDGLIKVIQGSGNGFFGKNSNQMARHAQGQWLCFLNNDTVLQPHWLDKLLSYAKKNPSVQVIGNIQVCDDVETVNHAGIAFDYQKRPLHLYEGLSVHTPGVQKDRLVQAVTAACCMISSKCFHALNGFDESYINGFEDVDLCLRAHARQWGVGVCGQSLIVHHGSSTPGRFDAETRNQERFQERWHSLVACDLAELTDADGINWPKRSRQYVILRACSKLPIVREVLRAATKYGMGIRFRQRMHQRAIKHAKMSR